MSLRILVLASGSGTLLQSLIDSSIAGSLPAKIVAVGSETDDAYALQRAKAAGIPTFVVPLDPGVKPGTGQRAAWDRDLREQIEFFAPGLVVMAGFMKLVGPDFLHEYGGRTINTHPGLLPDFPGPHAVRDALDAGVDQTAASVIWIDEGVDTGSVIVAEPVAIKPGDTEEKLHERIKVVERRLLVETVEKLAREGF